MNNRIKRANLTEGSLVLYQGLQVTSDHIHEPCPVDKTSKTLGNVPTNEPKQNITEKATINSAPQSSLPVMFSTNKMKIKIKKNTAAGNPFSQ